MVRGGQQLGHTNNEIARSLVLAVCGSVSLLFVHLIAGLDASQRTSKRELRRGTG